MDMNSIINRFLMKNPQARLRGLGIRTYARGLSLFYSFAFSVPLSHVHKLYYFAIDVLIRSRIKITHAANPTQRLKWFMFL